MNYTECIAYLDRLGNEVLTMKLGLETIRKLLAALQNPESRYPSVLVAGTNGKGSVARFLSSICRESGLRTGMFTSPHLVSVTERLRLDDRPISEQEFAEQYTHVVEVIGELGLETHPTFFETVTATALNYFSEKKVDIAILEVGLGGRLDSTNAVEPTLSILTEISYDHQQYLGSTLGQIAAEKAGILRGARPAISLPQTPEVERTVHDYSERIGCPLKTVDLSLFETTGSIGGCYSFSYRGSEYHLTACGEHQVSNAAIAVTAAEELQSLGIPIERKEIFRAIHETRMPGVLEKVGENPEVFLDGGHNPGAAANLVRFLSKHTREPRKLVLGMMKDKMLEEVSNLVTRPFQEVYLTQVPSPRSATADDLQQVYPRGIVIADPYHAYQKALVGASTTVVAGSFHLVGEILREIGGR